MSSSKHSFAIYVCKSVSAQGRGHQTSHRGPKLVEECSGTSLKPLTKEQRCGCVQVGVLRRCGCVCQNSPRGSARGRFTLTHLYMTASIRKKALRYLCECGSQKTRSLRLFKKQLAAVYTFIYFPAFLT